MSEDEKRIVPEDRIPGAIDELLNSAFWIPSIKAMSAYNRLHDDHDGTEQGKLVVIFSNDGDAHVWIEGERPGDSLRFRTDGGGGQSLHTRVALLILARAIQLDNEESEE